MGYECVLVLYLSLLADRQYRGGKQYGFDQLLISLYRRQRLQRCMRWKDQKERTPEVRRKLRHHFVLIWS